MSKTKRIVWFIIIAIIISLISYKFYHDNFVYETRSSTFLYDKNSAIYNFSKEETKEILDTFKIVIPENKKNVSVRRLSKTDPEKSKANWYCLKLYGVEDYVEFKDYNTYLKNDDYIYFNFNAMNAYKEKV